jgi:uncharacterized protein (DUF433 family)
MNHPYVEQRDSGYWVGRSRVSLDSIVYAFQRGQTPEGIVQSFPTLSLEMVYGAITYYLANRQQIDDYLSAGNEQYESQRQAAREADPAFYQKLAERRSQSQPS